ncbi:MAG: hypothetical protein ABFS34_05080 [Gemmatimonadota bacterium]
MNVQNWEAIGAVGEIVGAVAVVLTLLYLAKQIRQSSRSVEIGALRDTTSFWHRWSEMLATSPGLAEVVAKGSDSYEALTEAEKLRYGAFVQSFFDSVEAFRDLVVKFRVSRDLAVLESILARRLAVPGVYAWWRENTEDYDADFVAWVEEVRANSVSEDLEANDE